VKLIKVSPMGNMGNRMIQYMVALSLAERVPGARVVQIHLPEWGIQIAPSNGLVAHTGIVTESRIDLEGLAAALNDGSLDCVDIRTYGQHIDNFLAPHFYRDLFAAPPMQEAPGGHDEIVCNIRQGDILDAHHPDYVLIPPDFYAELVEATGLRPVFCGQLETSPYLRTIKKRFPGARYVPSLGAIQDFAFLRASRHIVPSISSFSWLAAWLSRADRIYMPVLGMFHPLQARSVNLLPLADPRFSFTLFPFHYAVPVAGVQRAHASLRGLWRGMPPARLGAMFAQRAQPPEAPPAFLFDEARYLATYPDIRQAVEGGHFPSGRHHYDAFGRAEGRECCAVDKAWYCSTYPMAAIELSQGDAADPVHHWLELGRNRGYRRQPG
jgi:hypothetical protein